MKNIQITSCLECPHHKIIADPDPYDSFCSDDKAVICLKVKKRKDLGSIYASNQQEFKTILVSERPYHITKERAKIPDWCPLE